MQRRPSLSENAVATERPDGGARRKSYVEPMRRVWLCWTSPPTRPRAGDPGGVFMQNGLLDPLSSWGRSAAATSPCPSTLSCIRAKLATSSRTLPQSHRRRLRRAGGSAAAAPSLRPGDFIVAGTSSAPGSLDATLRPAPQAPPFRPNAMPTTRRGCSTLRGRPVDQKARCSATAISLRRR